MRDVGNQWGLRVVYEKYIDIHKFKKLIVKNKYKFGL